MMARRSYALELVTTLFFSVALACVEGGVIAVIVKKTFGTVAAAGVLTIVPGAIVIWFVRHYIAKGFAMGRV